MTCETFKRPAPGSHIEKVDWREAPISPFRVDLVERHELLRLRIR
jgi:hypothetical protein